MQSSKFGNGEKISESEAQSGRVRTVFEAVQHLGLHVSTESSNTSANTEARLSQSANFQAPQPEVSTSPIQTYPNQTSANSVSSYSATEGNQFASIETNTTANGLPDISSVRETINQLLG